MEQNIFTVFLFLTLTFISVCYATDYCNPELCTYRKHIACGHNGKFSSRCPKDAKIVDLTESQKELIINQMNKHRNFIAGGGDKKHDPACRMATMQWNEELAELAVLNVKQCIMIHDRCHDTDEFRFSGQNLAMTSTTGKLNITNELISSIDDWYDEVKHSQMSYMQSYPANYRGPAIGHFTVMVAEKNTHAGCAAATYSEKGGFKSFLFACNFATTNIIKMPIYKGCSKAAAECLTGTTPEFENLCSTEEHYELNKWY